MRACRDGFTITTSVPWSQLILWGFEGLITWTKVSFEPSKLRSVVQKGRKLIDKFRFSFPGAVLKTSWNNLSRVWESSLTPAWKTLIPSGSSTKYFERGSPKLTSPVYLKDLSAFLWPQLVYAVSMRTVESFERKDSGFLWKWFRLPPCLTSTALYGTSNNLQLPF